MISLETKITLKQLKDYCMKYDGDYDSYPESEFEGLCVFNDVIDYMIEDTKIKDCE